MVTAVSTNELVGRVTRVHGSGFRLDGHPEWLNVSKFGSVDLPAVGAVVRATLDRAGFVRQVEPESSGQIPQIAAPSGPPAPAQAPASLSARIAALQAATAIVARGSGVETVLAMAERLEAWLCRS